MQGIVTGIRGLCNGLGPALYGLIFYIFHVNLTDNNKLNQDANLHPSLKPSTTNISSILERGDVLREQNVSLYPSGENCCYFIGDESRTINMNIVLIISFQF